MKVLDLFSGLGGFSEAFLVAGDEVCRVENNPLLSEVPCTSIEDVKAMRDRLLEYKISGQPIRQIDLVVASPPCLEFSLAFNAPRSVAGRNGKEHNPSMELIQVTLEIIQIIRPRWWVIEQEAMTTDAEGNAWITKRINLQKGLMHNLVQVDFFEDAYMT
ncbi:unnamed protein product, partial [marine sediment metagenome]